MLEFADYGVALVLEEVRDCLPPRVGEAEIAPLRDLRADERKALAVNLRAFLRKLKARDEAGENARVLRGHPGAEFREKRRRLRRLRRVELHALHLGRRSDERGRGGGVEAAILRNQAAGVLDGVGNLPHFDALPAGSIFVLHEVEARAAVEFVCGDGDSDRMLHLASRPAQNRLHAGCEKHRTGRMGGLCLFAIAAVCRALRHHFVTCSHFSVKHPETKVAKV